MNTFDLSFALRSLKDGKKLTRQGWNDSKRWIQLLKPGLNPVIYIKDDLDPWYSEQQDILAEDWKIVEDNEQFKHSPK